MVVLKHHSDSDTNALYVTSTLGVTQYIWDESSMTGPSVQCAFTVYTV